MRVGFVKFMALAFETKGSVLKTFAEFDIDSSDGWKHPALTTMPCQIFANLLAKVEIASWESQYQYRKKAVDGMDYENRNKHITSTNKLLMSAFEQDTTLSLLWTAKRRARVNVSVGYLEMLLNLDH